MCRNTIPTLRVLQEWQHDEEGKLYPSSYRLQQLDKQQGEWKNVPVVNKFPEPEQMELPLEDRPRI
jgi:hypothetical protein